MLARLAALALLLLAFSAGAFAQPLADSGDDDLGLTSRRTATLLSVVVPGGGQIYAGAPVTGGLLLIGAGAALAVGAAASVAASEREPFFGCPAPCWEFEPSQLRIGAGVAGALWLYGVVDAPAAATRNNRRCGLLATVEVAPATFRTPSGSTAAGLTLRASL